MSDDLGDYRIDTERLPSDYARTMMLFNTFEPDASLVEVLAWIDEFAPKEGWQLLSGYGRGPITEPLAQDFAKIRDPYDEDGLALIFVRQSALGGNEIRVRAMFKGAETGRVRLSIHGEAYYAYEAYYFYLLRDEIIHKFGLLERADQPKMGRPYTLDEASRRAVVRLWREKKASNMAKAEFVRAPIVIDGEEPLYISRKTLTRWEQEFPWA